MSWFNSFGQNDSIARATADTTNFSINIENGWKIYNSYVNVNENDSVDLELIIEHENPYNWTVDYFFGRIKMTDAHPISNRVLLCDLINRKFQIRVEQNGKCYIRQISGPIPTDLSFVLPIKVVYNKYN